MKRLVLLIFIVSWQSHFALAQPAQSLVEIVISPNHADWTYALGEEADFQVTVLKSNVPLPGITVHYSLGEEQMTPPTEEDVFLENGAILIKGGSMKIPGFKRCEVSLEYEGKIYTAWATAGFDPDKIQPAAELPSDFRAFWSKAIEENRKLPMLTKMTLLPDRCTEAVNVYEVSFQNTRPGTRVFGILCMPKAEGKYPAVLKVPGAGIRPYYGDVDLAEKGVITLEIGIHGISVTMPQQNYDDLRGGLAAGYWNYGKYDKDDFYYKRVYLGCIKANDFLCSLDQWDGQNLGVMGGSQGGGLSLVTAGLDSRVTAAALFYPALCDFNGYLKNRAGGWPHYLRDKEKWKEPAHKQMVQTLQYFDGVNFARNIKAPVWFSFGYNDNVVPPTSVSAAYNTISSSKEKMVVPETAHWTYPEQREVQREWMLKMLGK